MEELRGQAHRVATEASRRMQESTREATKVVNTLADRGAHTAAALTEANQRVLNEFVSLSMETFHESARLAMQIQQRAFDMMRESQAAVMRTQMAWPGLFSDPLRWYQSVCQETMDGARKTFDVINGSSEAMTESMSRLQASAEEAGTNIEHALTEAASRMKDAA